MSRRNHKNGPRPSFFRGSEFARLLLLLGIAGAGWAFFLSQQQQPARRPPAPAVTVAELPSMPGPDPAPELQGIQDRAGMTARDNAAYKLLLDRVRETPFKELRDSVRTDLIYSQLFDAPARYRGLPLHVEGLARRVLVQHVEGSKVFPSGKYYEAWVFTSDSMNNPYIIAFEDAPRDLLTGDNIQQRVSFDGYFLKLLAYLASDGKYRAAPLIVGRFPPASAEALKRPPATRRPNTPFQPTTVHYALGLLSLYAVLRLAFFIRRQTRPRPRLNIPRRQVTDQIDPEDLANWVDSSDP